MMNKTKSGLPAKLKATLVAPFAIILFFLFADFTMKGNERETFTPSVELQGLWLEQTEDNFSQALMIDRDQLSFTEGGEIRFFNIRFEKGKLILSEANSVSETELRYVVSGDKLTLWWNDNKSSTYTRSQAENTLDHLLKEYGLNLKLPYISQYRLLENETMLYRLSIELITGGEVSLAFDGKPIKISDLPALIERKKEELSKIDQRFLTAIFLVDQGVPMAEVDKVRRALRKMEALHFAEGGYPQGDMNLSPLIYHAVALPRLLPPLNAKVLDKKEMEKLGGNLHTIDLVARNTTPRDLDEGLRKFIGDNSDGKYLISLEFDGTIPYGQYVESVDMVWKTVYSFRNKLAMDRYSVPYDELGADIQKEIRRAYPMAMSESMK